MLEVRYIIQNLDYEETERIIRALIRSDLPEDWKLAERIRDQCTFQSDRGMI